MIAFNDACCNVFNKLFTEEKENVVPRELKRNLIFLTHRKLDCYSMFKVLKCIFGRANCVNLKEVLFNDMNSPIVAVNELIDKSIHNKLLANKDPEFKNIFEEVKQFVELKMQQL